MSYNLSIGLGTDIFFMRDSTTASLRLFGVLGLMGALFGCETRYLDPIATSTGQGETLSTPSPSQRDAGATSTPDLVILPVPDDVQMVGSSWALPAPETQDPSPNVSAPEFENVFSRTCSVVSEDFERLREVPAGYSVVDVTEFGATGDGTTDDGNAIEEAIVSARNSDSAHVHLYFPPGRYLVTRGFSIGVPTEGRRALTVMGAGAAHTEIILKDNTERFADTSSPVGVFSGNDSGSTVVNFRDFAIDVGTGNSGAIGVVWRSATGAEMRRLRVTGDAHIGVRIQSGRPRLYVQGLEVTGARTSVRIEDAIPVTVESLYARNFTETGIDNQGQLFAHCIQTQTSEDTPAIRIHPQAFGLVVGAQLSSDGDPESSGIEGPMESLYLQGISLSGYEGIGEYKQQEIFGFIGSPPAALFNNSRAHSLHLKTSVATEPPGPGPEPAVLSPPSNEGGDATDQLQALLHSGASDIILSPGVYALSYPVVIPASVRRILAPGATLRLHANHVLSPEQTARSLLTVSGATDTSLVIEDLQIDRATSVHEDTRYLEHVSTRALILRRVGIPDYVPVEPSGPIYSENSSIRMLSVRSNQSAWLRAPHWDRATDVGGRLFNRGTTWALGASIATSKSQMFTRDGGELELLGGYIGSAGTEVVGPVNGAAFRVVNARGTLSYVTESTRDRQLLEIRSNDTRLLSVGDLTLRDEGHSLSHATLVSAASQ